jgi:hypothetical protein
MRKNILPIQEIKRNQRVKELMEKKKNNKVHKFNREENEQLKGYMDSGFSFKESVELVLETRRLLNQKTSERESLKDWNKGGFITETKYKQPINHRRY